MGGIARWLFGLSEYLQARYRPRAAMQHCDTYIVFTTLCWHACARNGFASVWFHVLVSVSLPGSNHAGHIDTERTRICCSVLLNWAFVQVHRSGNWCASTQALQSAITLGSLCLRSAAVQHAVLRRHAQRLKVARSFFYLRSFQVHGGDDGAASDCRRCLCWDQVPARQQRFYIHEL